MNSRESTIIEGVDEADCRVDEAEAKCEEKEGL